MTDHTTHQPDGEAARRVTAAALTAARSPAQRSAALMLAVAQRDLGIARASSPAQVGEDSRVADPVAEYAAWVARMVDSERWAREGAVRSVAAGRDWDLTHDRSAGPLGAVTAAAIRRARAAIAVMTGPDEAAARAAREDALTGWYDDDRVALAALAAAQHPDGRGV